MIVATARNIRESIVHDVRRNIHVFAERGSRFEGESGARFIARQCLNAVIIKKVHNDAEFVSEVMDLMTIAKRRLFFLFEKFYTFYSMSYGKGYH